MPLRSYECLECGHGFDAIVGGSTLSGCEARGPCPKCGSNSLEESIVCQVARVYTPSKQIDPLELQMVMDNKRDLSSESAKRARDDGRITVVDAGPKEFRPEYNPTQKYY